MDFKKLLENKILLASIVGGVVLLLVVFIVCGTIAASNKSKNEQIDVSKEPLKEELIEKEPVQQIQQIETPLDLQNEQHKSSKPSHFINL